MSRLSFTGRLSRDDLISRAHTRAGALLCSQARAKLAPGQPASRLGCVPRPTRAQTYFHSSKSVHSSFAVHSGKVGHPTGGLSELRGARARSTGQRVAHPWRAQLESDLASFVAPAGRLAASSAAKSSTADQIKAKFTQRPPSL